MNSNIEDDIMDPVMQCTTLPSHSSFSQQKLLWQSAPASNSQAVNKSPTHYPCDFARTSELYLSIHSEDGNPALLYDGGGIPFQLKSDSLPHAHAQTTKTYYKHQDSRIKKAQDLKTKTSVNSDIQDLPSRYQDYQDNDCKGRLLESFQDDAKYEHVGQDIRSQGVKDDQD
ncbi:hypothetical protein Tco_1477065 [Tanacetum coccineum]